MLVFGARPVPSAPQRMRPRLLFVDDNVLSRDRLVVDIKSFFDCICLRAHDAVEGLAKFLSEHPDLVISDFDMPGVMDGLGLLHAVHRYSPRSPVVFVTGRGDNEDFVYMLLNAGAAAVVAKPVDTDELVKKLQNFLPAKP